jgi:hypothetical protein
MFQLSYKDYIRKWKDAQADDIKDIDKTTLVLDRSQPYRDHIVNISEVGLSYLSSDYWFNKSRKHEFYLVLEKDPTESAECKQSKSLYSDLLGLLPNIINRKFLDNNYKTFTEDFLTGMFLAKLIRTNKSRYNVFNFGISKPQLASGIKYYMKSQNDQTVIYGADHANIKDSYLNGVTRTGDICNLDTLKSIRLQISTTFADKLDIFVSDINPKNYKYLYNALAIGISEVAVDGFTVIRLFDLNKWQTFDEDDYTNMLHFFIFVASLYETVLIFKTPWSNRYYLILGNLFTDNIPYAQYIKFLSEHNIDCYARLLHDSLFEELSEDESDTEASISQLKESIISLLEKINHACDKLPKYNKKQSSEEANTQYIEQILGITSNNTEDPLDSPRPRPRTHLKNKI